VDLVLLPSDATFRRVLAAVRAEPPSLIVLDPLRNHLDGSENDSDAVVRAYRCLDALRVAGCCPVLSIHHLNKSGGFSGSRAITTRADLIIEGSDAETPTYSVRGRTVRPTVDAIAKPFTIAISHEHDGDDAIASTRLKFASEVDDAELPLGLSKLGRKILKFLSRQGEPRTANYIARSVSRGGSDVRNELEDLIAAGHVEFLPGGVIFGGRATDGFRRREHRTKAPDEGAPDVRRSEHRTSDDADPDAPGNPAGEHRT
jgi:predicted transcriptional regulator